MSLLMFRKYAPAHAADAHIDDITYKYKVGDKIKTPDGVGTVQKKTHTNSGKPAYEVKLDKGGVVVYFEQSVSAAHDSAPKFRLGQEVIVKTKYTEPYRARIVGLLDMSKNGPYDEQGYLIKNIKGGGVESMPEHALSLANAKDAQDANGDEVIAQKNGYKLVHNTLNDGYWFYTKSGAGWRITATNKVAAVNEFKRLVNQAKDSAADASEVQRVEKLLKRELTDAEFWKLGDYIMKHMKVGKTFTDNELLSAVKDSAESVDSNAEAIVNHDRIPVDQLGGEANARKHGYIIAKKGGRVYGVHIDGYSDKLAKKTIEEAGYTVVGDADELNNYADLRAALSKMADIAKRLTDAKVSFKAGWTPDGIGEIILEFPNIEIARKYNYYKLFNAWEAARSQIVPSWAVNIGGYSIPRIEGNRMTIGISHFST